jgi:hypothetical protein
LIHARGQQLILTATLPDEEPLLTQLHLGLAILLSQAMKLDAPLQFVRPGEALLPVHLPAKVSFALAPMCSVKAQ